MENLVRVGDYIRHPDDGKLYLVEDIGDEDTLLLDDYSYVEAERITEVLLESEAYDEFHRQER